MGGAGGQRRLVDLERVGLDQGQPVGGGFLEFAKTTKIYVLRRLSDGTTSMLPFNYK